MSSMHPGASRKSSARKPASTSASTAALATKSNPGPQAPGLAFPAGKYFAAGYIAQRVAEEVIKRCHDCGRQRRCGNCGGAGTYYPEPNHPHVIVCPNCEGRNGVADPKDLALFVYQVATIQEGKRRGVVFAYLCSDCKASRIRAAGG